MKTSLLFIGGFLGAGKTTLLAELAQRLQEKGEKVSIIISGQERDSVDLKVLASKGLNETEITGGYFCCKFDNLLETITKVAQNQQPTWILTEAAESCTELVETVIHPLKSWQSHSFHIAPITMAVDPEQANLLFEDRNPFSSENRHLFSRQIQEAEIVLLNKYDQVSNEIMEKVKKRLYKTNYKARFICTSAIQGFGLDQWMNEVCYIDDTSRKSRFHLLADEIDEAVDAHLGTLNASIKLTPKGFFHLDEFVKMIGLEIQAEFMRKGFEATHLQLMGQNSYRMMIGSLTKTMTEWEWYRHDQKLDPDTEISLFVNATVFAEPSQFSDSITNMIHKVSEQWNVRLLIDHLECFAGKDEAQLHHQLEGMMDNSGERFGMVR